VPIDDIKISEAIVRSFSEKLIDVMQSDVAIVGAGPAGLTAAYYLAAAGMKAANLIRGQSSKCTGV